MWSLRQTQYSHPASSVMDFIPMTLMPRLTPSTDLCFGLPGFLLPGGTIFRAILPTYSWYRLLTCPSHLKIAFLYLSVMFYTLSLSLIPRCHRFLHGLLVCGRMPIFISVTFSFFTCELVDLSVHVWWYFLAA